MTLILGSQSPRRRELLKGIDIPFEVVAIDADEHFPSYLQAGDIPLYIAKQKAETYLPQLLEDQLLITADTIVWLDGHMLGKPRSKEDAKHMLHRLSGQTHQVYTAVTFNATTSYQPISLAPSTPSLPFSFVDRTDVTFRVLAEEEIDYYVEHYSPLDKAGAYGVQEYIGYIGVEKISGSYFNVMGFPIERVYHYLKQLGF